MHKTTNKENTIRNKHSWTSNSAPVAHITDRRRSVLPTLAGLAPITAKCGVSIKPEVYNVARCHRRRTEPRPQGICTQNFVPIGPAVSEICWRTDRQTHRHTGWSKYRSGIIVNDLLTYLLTYCDDGLKRWAHCAFSTRSRCSDYANLSQLEPYMSYLLIFMMYSQSAQLLLQSSRRSSLQGSQQQLQQSLSYSLRYGTSIHCVLLYSHCYITQFKNRWKDRSMDRRT